MADLVTHVATALLAKAGTGGRDVVTLAVGVVLPDLLGRMPVVVGLALANEGVPLPDVVIYGWAVLHLPLGIVPLCFLLSQAFVHTRAAFLNLTAGCFLHLALDLLQRHTGSGYPLLFPFSDWDWELGLLGTEDTVPWSLPLLVLGCVGLWLRRRRSASAEAQR